MSGGQTSHPKPFLDLLTRSVNDPLPSHPPVWLMRQAGRYLPEYREVRAKAGDFLNLCYTPKLATEVTLQPIRRYGFDAAILFSDILVVPDALGQQVRFETGEGPRLDPIDAQHLARLDQDNTVEKFSLVFETVERIRSSLPAETTLIGFCGAPFTVATYMVAGHGTPDQAPARLMAYSDRDTFQRLIDLLVETSISYLRGQVEAGAEVLQIFDSWASVLPDDEFDAWVLEPMVRITSALRQYCPGVPIIGFPRAVGPLYQRYVEKTSVDAVSCDTSLPLEFIRDQLQPKTVVQGNLDPLLLLTGGAALDDRVKRIVETLSAGRHIFNLGHGILPQTPPEHVERLMQLIRGEV